MTSIPFSQQEHDSRKAITVIWIDWYAYHLARFRAIVEQCAGIEVNGIELVGQAGVHRGFQFREDNREGLPVSTLLPDQSWHGAGQMRIAAATWKKLNQLNPAMVLVPGYYTVPAITAAVWARVRRRRAVLMTESTEQDHSRTQWKEKAKSLLIRSLFGWAIAGGEPHLRYLAKLGFPMHRVGRFYNVVDNEFFATRADQLRQKHHPAEFGLPSKYFLYVGRLAEEKNILGLLKAFGDYRKTGGTWDLVVAGDGPLGAEARAYVEQIGLGDHVCWMGMQSSHDLANLYAFASCFVLPSTREPWGLVVNEALAAGAPVLVSERCGCAQDLVRDGQNGLLFDPFVPGKLTEALRQFEAMTDRDRQLMGECSRAIVARYSPQAWAREVERIALAA